jgi:hypothetical protein
MGKLLRCSLLMKKVLSLFIICCLGLPLLAHADPTHIDFTPLVLAVGVATAVALLIGYLVGALLAVRLSEVTTTLVCLHGFLAVGWGVTTYSCFNWLLFPAIYYLKPSQLFNPFNLDFQPITATWFWVDAGCATLGTALAWYMWQQRRLKLQRLAEIEASLR